jgi:predicted nucleotidyltransferase
MEKKIQDLREREKELNCMYRVHEALKREDLALRDALRNAIEHIPDGWQYPGLCMVKLELDEYHITTSHFFETNVFQSADIVVDENVVGTIYIYYSQHPSHSQSNPAFLPEERHLLNNIAGQIAQAIFIRRLKSTIEYMGKESKVPSAGSELLKTDSDHHWRWRKKMVEALTDRIDFSYFGIFHIYLIGSVKEATAGPKSDIDLLIHVAGDQAKEKLLKEWISGWGHALAQINYEKTGYWVEGSLIDIHLIYSEEIQNKTNSYASMIGSIHNSARLIK